MSEPVSIDTLEMILNQMSAEDTSLYHDGEVVTNGDVLKDYRDLVAEKDARVASVEGSMGGIDTSDLDEKIEQAKTRAREYVARLHFKAVSNDEYLRIVAKHPEAKNGWDAEYTVPWHMLVTELADACYTGCTIRGEKLDKIRAPLKTFLSHPAIGFGQLEPIFTDVFALNKREPDRSFLSER